MVDYNTKLLYMMNIVGSLTIRVRFEMTDDVDSDILQESVQKAMKRFPFLAKKIVLRDETYYLEDNPAPIPVFETKHPMPDFGSNELDEHLICVDYEGRYIYFTMLHTLSGGPGTLHWAYTTLYQYIMDKYGVEPENDKVRKPYLPPEPGEGPIEALRPMPEMEINWKGFPPEVKPISSSALEEQLAQDDERDYYVSLFTIDEKKLMEIIKKNETSPAAWFAVMYYRSLIRILPEVPEYMDLSLACDLTTHHGTPETISLVTKFLHFVIDREDEKTDDKTLCKKGRQMMKEQLDPGALNHYLNSEQAVIDEMKNCESIAEKTKYYMSHTPALSELPTTLMVSYMGKLDMPGTEKYIKKVGIYGANTQRSLTVNTGNGCFTITVFHPYKDDKSVNSFEQVLKDAGVEIISLERSLQQKNVGLKLPTA
ncbi:MAG: hypothetical protein K5639_00660 [Eubacterium sp.]|nr:hypothetical protein [Eubacterium sp.]